MLVENVKERYLEKIVISNIFSLFVNLTVIKIIVILLNPKIISWMMKNMKKLLWNIFMQWKLHNVHLVTNMFWVKIKMLTSKVTTFVGHVKHHFRAKKSLFIIHWQCVNRQKVLNHHISSKRFIILQQRSKILFQIFSKNLKRIHIRFWKELKKKEKALIMNYKLRLNNLKIQSNKENLKDKGKTLNSNNNSKRFKRSMNIKGMIFLNKRNKTKLILTQKNRRRFKITSQLRTANLLL